MRRTIQLAVVIVGSFVGAGYMSGQELIVFFLRYGAHVDAVLLSVCLTIVATSLLAGAALRMKCFHLFHWHERLWPSSGRWWTNVFTVAIIVLTSVMVAALVEFVALKLQWSRWEAQIVVLVVMSLVMVRGIKAVVEVNFLFVPCLLVLLMQLPQGPFSVGQWSLPLVLSLLSYSALNVVFLLLVLLPLLVNVTARQLYGACLFGGLALLWSVITFVPLLQRYTGVHSLSLPFYGVVALAFPALFSFFQLVLVGELSSTLIGNLVSLSERFARYKWMILGIIGSISTLPFERLVGAIYPSLGTMSFIYLMLITVSLGGERWIGIINKQSLVKWPKRYSR